MKTKVKEKSLQVLIKEADTVFSEFIRLRDADENGTVTCFVSGERVFWRDSDAAHYIVRQHMSTRWDEINVHACSIDSNRYDDKHQEKYSEKMWSTYGQSIMLNLRGKAQSLMKYTRSDLIELIDKYKVKVAALRKQKNL